MAEGRSSEADKETGTDPFGRPSETRIPPKVPPSMPRRIGGYTLKSVLASGGMGTVYLAVQEHPRRTVALKVMRSGIASRSALRRFEYEAQILARLRHPYIAQVYDAGTHDDGSGGVPYFAMEYVPNALTIIDYARRHELGTRERIALFSKVCEAIHHGHLKGIIHRDLKPGNILVDSAGLPRIIDFGVARATDSDMAVTTAQTDLGQLIGTLQYMSPEQCDADPHDLDTRSDVYALGVVLYELLCERLPYDISGAALHEAARVIHERAPARPSTVNRTLRGDVETITLKALEKNRTRRYQSADELRRDIDSYLSGEPISARPPSVMYQFRVFTRRHKVMVGAIGAVFVVLLAAGVFSTTQYIAAEAARKEAVSALGEAAVARRNQEQLRQLAENERDRALEAERLARREAFHANIAAARAALDVFEITTVRQRLDAVPADLRNWEWRYIAAAADQSLTVLDGHEGHVKDAVFSPDGTLLVSGSYDRTVRLWDAASGREIAVLRGHEDGVISVAFSPDGTRLVSTSWDRTARIWNVLTGAQEAILQGHENGVISVAFSPDGTRLATGSGDKTVRIWSASSGRELATLVGHAKSVQSVAFSPDGTRLVSASWDRTARIWDASTGRVLHVLRGHEDGLSDVAFSPDGTRLVSSSWDSTVRIWSVETGQELAKLQGHQEGVLAVAFNPDGTRLASAADDRTVRLWDASTGESVKILRGHEHWVQSVAFSPDGTRLASGAFDNTVRIWDLSSDGELQVFGGYEASLPDVAFSPDGTRLAATSGDATVRLWDVATGQELAVLRSHQGPVISVAFSPDGASLASASDDHTVRTWNSSTGEELLVLAGHEGRVQSVVFSPDGTRLASCAFDNTVRVWDASTGRALATLRSHEGHVLSVTFSPDGTRLASGAGDATVRIWDVLSGETLMVLRGHGGSVYSVAFSPDGTLLASASRDRTMRLWAATAGEILNVLRGHTGAVYDVAFSPDGTRLVSGSWDRTVRLWDVSMGDQLAVLGRHRLRVWSITFGPDGKRLAAGSADGTVRLWDTVPYRIRYGQRQEVLAAESDAKPLVGKLFEQSLKPAQIASVIRADETLSDAFRHGALNLLLKKCDAVRARVDELFARYVLSQTVIEELRSDPDLATTSREMALSVAERRGDHPARLNSDSWMLVRESGRESYEYVFGLRGAEAACAAEPGNGGWLNTLGVAQYRMGRYREALETLARSNVLNAETFEGNLPYDIAFIAMAHYRLGKTAEARASLSQLREIMRDPRYADDEESRNFLRETEALFEGAAELPGQG